MATNVIAIAAIAAAAHAAPVRPERPPLPMSREVATNYYAQMDRWARYVVMTNMAARIEEVKRRDAARKNAQAAKDREVAK